MLIKAVTVLWLGSNKVLIPEFEFDFDQLDWADDDTPYTLQQLVADAMHDTRPSARVLYKNKDVAPLPQTASASQNYVNTKALKQIWATLVPELLSTTKITLHASRFSQVDVWIHELVTSGSIYVLPPEAFHNRQFVLKACYNYWVCKYASEALRSDREFVLAMCKRCGDALEHVSAELRKDRKVVLAAVRNRGFALKFAHQELQADREIAVAAVKQSACALKYVAETLLTDHEFLQEFRGP